MIDLSIITVTWNSAETIVPQLKSVKLAAAGINYEQFVVDNASADETVSLVRGFLPLDKIIENKENLGFAKANNLALPKTSGQHVLFLNPDISLRSNSLKKWLEWFKASPKVSISGCKLVNKHGVINTKALPRRFPTWWDQLMVVLKIPHFFPTVLNKYLYQDLDFSKNQIVDSVRGSCLLVKRELLNKLGHAFDERFFIWFEDVDLCKEARRLNYQVAYTPIVSAVDFVGHSFKKRNVIWKQWQLLKSMYNYFKKWGLKHGK